MSDNLRRGQRGEVYLEQGVRKIDGTKCGTNPLLFSDLDPLHWEVLTSCTLSQQAIHLTSKHETTSKELYLEESKILHSNTLINLHSGAGFSPNKLL